MGSIQKPGFTNKMGRQGRLIRDLPPTLRCPAQVLVQMGYGLLSQAALYVPFVI